MIIIKLSFNRIKYCKIASNNFGSFSNFCNFRKITKNRPIFGDEMVTFQTFGKQKIRSRKCNLMNIVSGYFYKNIDFC